MQTRLPHYIDNYMDKLAYDIDASDLKAALDTGKSIVIVDARAPDSFLAKHLPDAASTPQRTMHGGITRHLGQPIPIATCRDNTGRNASIETPPTMRRPGFYVKEWFGGLDWRKRDGYPTAIDAEYTATIGCGCTGRPRHAQPRFRHFAAALIGTIAAHSEFQHSNETNRKVAHVSSIPTCPDQHCSRISSDGRPGNGRFCRAARRDQCLSGIEPRLRLAP